MNNENGELASSSVRFVPFRFPFWPARQEGNLSSLLREGIVGICLMKNEERASMEEGAGHRTHVDRT